MYMDMLDLVILWNKNNKDLPYIVLTTYLAIYYRIMKLVWPLQLLQHKTYNLLNHTLYQPNKTRLPTALDLLTSEVFLSLQRE